MTTYNSSAVTDAVIAYQKPVTLQQGRALRNNPIAIAEADASVPAGLLPTVLLGTISTVSGASASLTGLNLAPYKFLKMVWQYVSHNDSLGPQAFRIGSASVTGNLDRSVSANFMSEVELSTGLAVGYGPQSGSGLSGITNASTTVTISPSGGAFDGGSVRVYGAK